MIDPLNGSPAARLAPASSHSPTASSAPVTAIGVIAPAAAELSPLATAAKALAAAPPVDAARVANVRAALASGSYAVDPHAIADAMLRLEAGRDD